MLNRTIIITQCAPHLDAIITTNSVPPTVCKSRRLRSYMIGTQSGYPRLVNLTDLFINPCHSILISVLNFRGDSSVLSSFSPSHGPMRINTISSLPARACLKGDYLCEKIVSNLLDLCYVLTSICVYLFFWQERFSSKRIFLMEEVLYYINSP